jgi:hypothetical protein
MAHFCQSVLLDGPFSSVSAQYKTRGKSDEMRIMKMQTWLPWLPATHSTLDKRACHGPATMDN